MLPRWAMVLTGLISLKVFSVAQDSALEEAWRDWKTTYGKVYTQEKEASRRATWEKNLQMVEQHNREADEGKHTYWMKMNQFSDLADEEFNRMMGGLHPDSVDPDNASQGFPQMPDIQQTPRSTKCQQRHHGTSRKDQLAVASRRRLGKRRSENFGKLCRISSNGTKKALGRLCRCISRYRRRCQKCCKLVS